MLFSNIFFLYFQELVDALKALSTFFGENTLRARRNLRGDVEKRSLEISEQFESQFKEVKTVRNQLKETILLDSYQTLFIKGFRHEKLLL